MIIFKSQTVQTNGKDTTKLVEQYVQEKRKNDLVRYSPKDRVTRF